MIVAEHICESSGSLFAARLLDDRVLERGSPLMVAVTAVRSFILHKSSRGRRRKVQQDQIQLFPTSLSVRQEAEALSSMESLNRLLLGREAEWAARLADLDLRHERDERRQEGVLL